MSFTLSNFSTSYFSRPNARTTRTPVRFSCSTALMRPSASSVSRKRFIVSLKNTMPYKNSIGTSISDTSVILTFMFSIITSAITSMNTARNISTNCPDRNRRTVSTSDVQRCIRSPVAAFT